MIPQFASMASGGPVGSYGPLPQASPSGEHAPPVPVPAPPAADKDDLTTPTYWSASRLLDEHEHRVQSEAIRQHQQEYHGGRQQAAG